MPTELNGRLLNYNQLIALETTPRSDAPERRIDVTLTGGMMSYESMINGRTYADAEPFEIRAGECVRLRITNRSTMRHPMRLHGHSYRVLHENAGNNAPFKDTLIVNHMEKIGVEFLTDNPGDWHFAAIIHITWIQE